MKKKLIIKTMVCLVIITILGATLFGCSIFSSYSDANKNTEYTVTVHYYDDITRSYTFNTYKTVQLAFLAKSGDYMIGVFDSDGVQYSDCDGILDTSKSSYPTDLYAKYATYSGTYKTEVDNDENPVVVQFWQPAGFVYEASFKKHNSEQGKKLAAACMCNPYADLKITLHYSVKGNSTSGNIFQAFMYVGDETIAGYSNKEYLDSYEKKTLTAKIKAKQFTSNKFELNAKLNSNYGYNNYYIKNVYATFELIFSENSEEE